MHYLQEIKERKKISKEKCNLVLRDIGIVIIISLIFMYMGFQNYLLFHSFIELFCVYTAFTMTFIVMNTRDIYQSNYFIFLGIAYGFVGTFDLVHTFAYKGMGFFSGDGIDLPTQLWIAARYIQSISLLISIRYFNSSINMKKVVTWYGLISVVLFLSIFKWNIFPKCFIEGTGVTLFKEFSEYIICTILLTTIIHVIKNKDKYSRSIFFYNLVSIVSMIISEVFFTQYIHSYGLSNRIGHIFKLISFYYLFKSINEIGIKIPYKTVFYEVLQSNSSFKFGNKKLLEKDKKIDLSNINKETIKNSIQENKETYKNLFQFLSEGILIHTGEEIIFANEACKQILGFKEEEDIIGTKVLDIVHEDYKNVVKDRIDQGLKGESCPYIERKLIKKDGSYIDVEVSANKIEYFGKSSMMVIVRDITERKKTQTILKQNEENYKRLFDSLPEAIFVYNKEKIAFANKEAIKLIGLEDIDQIVGKPIIHSINEKSEERKLIENIIDTVMNEKKSIYSLEHKLRKKSGEILDLDISSVPFQYNEEINMLTVIRDITERKKVEEEKRDFEEAMAHEKIKTEFFSNMSHELKTPINVIFGAIQLMESYANKEKNHSKNAYKHIDIIKQNCRRLIRLINNIIDITKLDGGFYKIKLQNHNIIGIVEDITLSINEYTKSKDIELEFDTEIEEKIMGIDPDKIERIILNLLSNAIKFTNKGGKISVNIRDKGKNILISVKDTGMGIPKNKLKEIFERFAQVDKTLSINKEGSGIGLSLVKSLVELHGGSIFLNSEYGKGSEFIINLPVKRVKDEATEDENISNQYKNNNIERIQIEFSDIYA